MSTPLDNLFVDESPYFPDEFDQFLLKQTDNNRDHAVAINARRIGLYLQQEIYSGQMTWDNRPIYQTVIDIGTLPGAPGTVGYDHNLPVTADWLFFPAPSGSAKDPTAPLWIPLPYSDPTAANCIGVDVNLTQILITVGVNRSNFTESYILLQYTKG